MSKEGSPEFTKSWVFVDSKQENKELAKDTSGLQEVTENEPHIDSDTDSISVISESGCSYKTDEEEFTYTEVPIEQEKASDEPEFAEREPEISESGSEISEAESEIAKSAPQRAVRMFDEDEAVDKLLYFATSAVCAIILIGFSVAVQHYFQDASNVNIFDPDQVGFSRVQNTKSEVINEGPSKKNNQKRKSQFKLDELENKIAKLQEDQILSPVRDNDPKSNNKLNRNKKTAAKCNKENCDVNERRGNGNHPEKSRFAEMEKNDKKMNNEDSDDENRRGDATCNKKIKELKVKEDYLKEKEKFLIEKEHNLLKKEIKLNKEKQHYEKSKHDKKTYRKKENELKGDESGEKKSNFKVNKDNAKSKEDNKCKHKEEKKQPSPQKRYKFADEQHKKRNISGQWYINLHEARDNMRKKRSSFKKNKANWYFQWMVDRARLRIK